MLNCLFFVPDPSAKDHVFVTETNSETAVFAFEDELAQIGSVNDLLLRVAICCSCHTAIGPRPRAAARNFCCTVKGRFSLKVFLVIAINN
jgi:hypothetical protein